MDASHYVWDRLWEPMQDAKASFDVLDIVRLQNSVIQGWLFTTADGQVKSKSRHRWRIEMVGERCCLDGVSFRAHAYVKDKWVNITDYDILAQVSKSPQCKAIVPFGFVGKSWYVFLTLIPLLDYWFSCSNFP